MEMNSVNNKIIHSFQEVDLSAIAIPSIAIYKHPRDIPDKYVATLRHQPSISRNFWMPFRKQMRSRSISTAMVEA